MDDTKEVEILDAGFLGQIFDASKEEIEKFIKEEEKSIVLDYEKIKSY
ncbi:hypothetical protein [Candidatus Nanopusillus massiliensis]|nr:hypothetical protein [Candidatus Nanopusillus massiliensis]